MAARSSYFLRSLAALQKPTTVTTTWSNTINRNLFINGRREVAYVYNITLTTGDVFAAGTDANVYIRMIGERGSSDEIQLATKKGDLERGMENSYRFSADYVGHMKKLIIRHDNTGLGSAWFLEKVKIRDGKGQSFHFKCNQWLAKTSTHDTVKLIKEDSFQQKEAVGNVSTKRQCAKDLVNKVSSDSQTVPSDDVILQGVMKKIVANEEVTRGNEATIDHYKDMVIPKDETVSVRNITEMPKEPIHYPTSTKHANSSSPAVRNLLDTYDISMLKVTATGPHSRLLKGDILKYIEYEKITKKKQVVHTPLDEGLSSKQNSKTTTVKSTSAVTNKMHQMASRPTVTYVDRITTNEDKLSASNIARNKFIIPHLYMTTKCKVGAFQQLMDTLYNSSDSSSAILVRMFCRSFLDIVSGYISVDENVHLEVTSSNGLVLLKNCNQLDFDAVCKILRTDKSSTMGDVVPQFSLNIPDLTEGVTQTSSILKPEQLLNLTYSGWKISVDADGKLTSSVTVAVSYDGRVISEELCAACLEKFKSYLENPNMLSL